jgi:hypothetical protein
MIEQLPTPCLKDNQSGYALGYVRSCADDVTTTMSSSLSFLKVIFAKKTAFKAIFKVKK